MTCHSPKGHKIMKSVSIRRLTSNGVLDDSVQLNNGVKQKSKAKLTLCHTNYATVLFNPAASCKNFITADALYKHIQ